MRTIKVRAARTEAQMQRKGFDGDASDQHATPSVPHSQCGGEVGRVGSAAYVDGYIKYILNITIHWELFDFLSWLLRDIICNWHRRCTVSALLPTTS